MLNKKINRIKTYFVLLGVLIIVAMYAGITGLNKSQYLQSEYIGGKVSYMRYWLEYMVSQKALAASVRSSFDKTQRYESTGENASDIPVLVYHGLLDEEDDSAGLNTTTDNFKDQMFALKSAGYETVKTDDLYKYLRGEITLPPKSFMLAFDDGRRDSYYNADPILQALGYEAVMFAVTEYAFDLESDYYLSKDELRHLEESDRWEVQAHAHGGHGFIPIDESGTLGNFYSHKKWLSAERRLETDDEYETRVREDIRLAKKELEDEFDKHIIAFTFPFGDFGQFDTNYPDARDVLVRTVASEYPILFYQTLPGMQFTSNYFDEAKQGSGLFLVRRVDYNRHWTGRGSLLDLMHEIGAKSLPYSDTFTRNNGWVLAWGDQRFSGDALTIFSRTPQAGGAVVLDGSGGWKDYEVRATVDSPGQDGAYMWVRFQDEFNAAACNFGNGFAHIEVTVNGEKRVLKGVRNDNIDIPAGDFEITARVEGRTLECTLNGEVTVSTEFLDQSLAQGGIGFKTWSDQDAQHTLSIKDLEVRALTDDGTPVSAFRSSAERSASAAL